MKRVVATVSAVTVLGLSTMGGLAAVAAAPASAGTIHFFGVTATCTESMEPQSAQYTLTYRMHSFTFTVPGAKCLF
jgi:predicted nicotinamide N-methyase